MRPLKIGDYVGLPNHVTVEELMPNKHLLLSCNFEQQSGINGSEFRFYAPMDMEGLDMEIANSYILPEFSISKLKDIELAIIQDAIKYHTLVEDHEGLEDIETFINENTPYSESMGIYFQINAVVHPVNTTKLRKLLYTSSIIDGLPEESKDLLEEWVEQGSRLAGIFEETNSEKRYQALLSRSDKYQHYPSEVNTYIKYCRANLKLYPKNKERLKDLKAKLLSKHLFSGIVTDVLPKDRVCVLLDNKKTHIVFESKNLVNFGNAKQLDLGL